MRQFLVITLFDTILDVITNSNVDFYSLDSKILFNVLKNDVEIIPVFFFNYKLEKENFNHTITHDTPLNQQTNTQEEDLSENSNQTESSLSIGGSYHTESDSGDGYDSKDEKADLVTQPIMDVEHSNHSALPGIIIRILV